jgi:hypothetical protein
MLTRHIRFITLLTLVFSFVFVGLANVRTASAGDPFPKEPTKGGISCEQFAEKASFTYKPGSFYYLKGGVALEAGQVITVSTVLGDPYTTFDSLSAKDLASSRINVWIDGIGVVIDQAVPFTASYTVTTAGTHNIQVAAEKSNGNYVPVVVDCGGAAKADNAPLFTDGRLNNNDAGQTVAVYCADNGLEVYGVLNGEGYKAFSISQEEIDAVPAKPQVNTLIKEVNSIRLYRLTSGKLQLMAPATEASKADYKFIFSDCL